VVLSIFACSKKALRGQAAAQRRTGERSGDGVTPNHRRAIPGGRGFHPALNATKQGRSSASTPHAPSQCLPMGHSRAKPTQVRGARHGRA